MNPKTYEHPPIRILHLEDSPMDAELIRERLLDMEFDLSIDCAKTEKEFVRFIKKCSHDLIIADFKLPGFDAFGALQKVLETCPDVPFICVSGTIGEEAAVELMRQGAVDYVIKDRLGRLPSSIKRALAEAKERKALREAEDALRQSEGKYRGIFENIQDVYYEADLSGLLLEVSPSVKSLSEGQYDRMDLIGQSFEQLFDDQEDWKTLFAVLKDQGSVSDYEIRLRNRDHSIIYCSINSKLTKASGQPGIIIGSLRDISIRKKAEEEIKKSLQEKEILLRELYHRTKNNMQVIQSMLELKVVRSKNKDLQMMVREIENKIQSMALVHKKLYESENLSTLNLKTYFEELIILIKNNYSIDPDHIRIHYRAVDAPVLIDTAIPLGLVFNELLSNIAKHAFPEERNGEVNIVLSHDTEQGLTIEIKDNGMGLPEGFDIEKNSDLGLQTAISMIRHQLDGDIEFVNDHGLACRITLKKEMYEPRV